MTFGTDILMRAFKGCKFDNYSLKFGNPVFDCLYTRRFV